MRSRLVGETPYYAYTVPEFREKYPDTEYSTDWRSANTGDWVLSDDEHVCQVRKRYIATKKWPGHHPYDIVKTAFGTFSINPGNRMHTDPTRLSCSGSMMKRKHPYGIPNREKCTNSEYLFGVYVAQGMNPIDAFRKAFPKAHYEQYVVARAKGLLKAERVKLVIKQTVEDAAKQLGLDAKYVLERLKSLAEASDLDGVRLGAIKEIQRLLDLEPTNTHTQINGRLSYRVASGNRLEQADYEMIADEGPAKLTAEAEG